MSKKYSEAEIRRAQNNCPVWMKKTIISKSGKVLGLYAFSTKEMTIINYNNGLRGKLYDFEAPYLRDAVWPLEMKIGLIWSICHDVKLPSFWLAEQLEDASNSDIIDSKNRSLAIYEFFNNDFPISIDIDGETTDFYWCDIEKCKPPQSKFTKKLTPTQERLKNLNIRINNYTISVNTVVGCSTTQRAELSAILSKSISWTVEEGLFNFNWHSKALFKFLFKFCLQETKLSNNITDKSIAENKRDKGTIFIAKIFWLLYGDLFKDSYSERSLGNNIQSYKKESNKSPFVKYIEKLNKEILDFIEKENMTKPLESLENFQGLFEFIESDFSRIDSLRKTCKLINDIMMIHGITKKLHANDMLDLIVHIERKIKEKVFTHAMLKNEKQKFFDLIKLFKSKKDKIGAIATAQSTTLGKIRHRKEIFEECLVELDFDIGIKNKKISKNQREYAIFQSNGYDPITGEKLLDGEIHADHRNSKALYSNPGEIVVMSPESNRLKNNITSDYAKNLNGFMNHGKAEIKALENFKANKAK
jgi:hypothetical protein